MSRRMRLAFLWVVAFSGTSFAQSGWFWQNPLPTGNPLAGAAVLSAQIAVAVGSAGTILRTTDGGASWVPQLSGTTASLNGVVFVDPNTGIAVGSRGTILRTT